MPFVLSLFTFKWRLTSDSRALPPPTSISQTVKLNSVTTMPAVLLTAYKVNIYTRGDILELTSQRYLICTLPPSDDQAISRPNNEHNLHVAGSVEEFFRASARTQLNGKNI